jgi:3-hydroxybutyryl-CoA dehydrogenase
MVELTRTAATSAEAADRVEAFFRSLGYATIWVADAPGLVLGRIVAQVVNECAFAIGEGVGTAADIDFGMRHGLSYPRGPLEWADAIGVRHVLLVLDALRREYGEERYRVAPLLRRTATFHRSP